MLFMEAIMDRLFLPRALEAARKARNKRDLRRIATVVSNHYVEDGQGCGCVTTQAFVGRKGDDILIRNSEGEYIYFPYF